jgi:hypothetical protein
MKIKLTKSQISYLKSLDSKKKKRKFLLDCLVENICVEETQSPKPNYSPEEIELVKHNINQREVSEQGSELLKFDMLEKSKKSFFLNKEQIEDSKEKEQKVYKYMFYSLVELKQDKIDEIIEFITENNQNAN